MAEVTVDFENPESFTDEVKEGIKGYVNSNWREFISEEYSTDASMADFNSFDDVSKSFINTKKMVGKKGIILPGEDATEDEWNVFHKDMGRPDEADGYELSFHEEITNDENFGNVEENLNNNMKTFKETMHKLGIPASTAKKMWENSQEQWLQASKAQSETNKERLMQEEAAVKKELGAAYEEKMELANNVATSIMSSEDIEWFKQNGLFKEPRMRKILSKIGDMISEDKIKVIPKAGTTLTPNDAKSKLNALLSKDSNHPLSAALHNKKDPRHNEAMKLFSDLNQMAIAE